MLPIEAPPDFPKPARADPAPLRRDFPSPVCFRFPVEEADVTTAAIVVGGRLLPLSAASNGVAGRALDGSSTGLALADQLNEEEAAKASV